MSLSEVVSGAFLVVVVVVLVNMLLAPPKQAFCSCKRCEGCQYGAEPHVHLEVDCKLHGDHRVRTYSWACPKRGCGTRINSTDGNTVMALSQAHRERHERESGRA